MTEKMQLKPKVTNYGLINGLMGETIFKFYLSRKNKDPELEKFAEQLLEQVAEQISFVDSFDYANGLAGIGFGIEWLSQNGYLDENTDELLEEIDNELYKSVVYAKNKVQDLFYGTLGKAHYFHKRLQAKNPNQNRYKRICLIECLILLSDELSEYLLEENTGLLLKKMKNMSEDDLGIVSHVLILFEKLLVDRTNLECVKQTLCGIYKFVEKLNFKRQAKLSHLQLVYSFALVGRRLQDPIWQRKSEQLYSDILRNSNLNNIDPVIDFIQNELACFFDFPYTREYKKKNVASILDLVLLDNDTLPELLLWK
ncbi:hypothetical protein ABIB40_002912 [Pedobacter sp. UYP30]|uniref:lanthionine synthetase LanC family protein n=1 Tax=Pedobacter sp. UYP30 TaxID=1756400 RepID=UPI00339819A9